MAIYFADSSHRLRMELDYLLTDNQVLLLENFKKFVGESQLATIGTGFGILLDFLSLEVDGRGVYCANLEMAHKFYCSERPQYQKQLAKEVELNTRGSTNLEDYHTLELRLQQLFTEMTELKADVRDASSEIKHARLLGSRHIPEEQPTYDKRIQALRTFHRNNFSEIIEIMTRMIRSWVYTGLAWGGRWIIHYAQLRNNDGSLGPLPKAADGNDGDHDSAYGGESIIPITDRELQERMKVLQKTFPINARERRNAAAAFLLIQKEVAGLSPADPPTQVRFSYGIRYNILMRELFEPDLPFWVDLAKWGTMKAFLDAHPLKEEGAVDSDSKVA